MGGKWGGNKCKWVKLWFYEGKDEKEPGCLDTCIGGTPCCVGSGHILWTDSDWTRNTRKSQLPCFTPNSHRSAFVGIRKTPLKISPLNVHTLTPLLLLLFVKADSLWSLCSNDLFSLLDQHGGSLFSHGETLRETDVKQPRAARITSQRDREHRGEACKRRREKLPRQTRDSMFRFEDPLKR